MSFFRYIYVFILAFLIGGGDISVCDGAVKQTQAGRSTHFGYAGQKRHTPFESILRSPLSNGSELARDHQHSIHKNIRERETTHSLPGLTAAYSFSARAFSPLLAFSAGQPAWFISFATLLVFPHHWFW